MHVCITYDAHMRSTVDLPPSVHQRVRERAQERGLSVSATLAELTIRGLAAEGQGVTVSTDPATGFPVVSVGRVVTAEDVAATLDEE